MYEITRSETQQMETNDQRSLIQMYYKEREKKPQSELNCTFLFQFIFILCVTLTLILNQEIQTQECMVKSIDFILFHFITFYDGKVSKSIRCKIMSPSTKPNAFYNVYNKYTALFRFSSHASGSIYQTRTSQ